MTFALLVLGAYRLTTLVTTDTITGPVRRRAAVRWPATGGRPSWQVELLRCGRCIGWWASGLAASYGWASGMLAGGRWFPVYWLATAGAVSLLVTVAP